MKRSVLFIIICLQICFLYGQSVKRLPISKIFFDTTIHPNIFEIAFSGDSIIDYPNFSGKFYTRKIGNIKIETGKIIGSDLLFMHGASAFTETFPIGNFPVELAFNTESSNKKPSYCRILFSSEPVKKWVVCLKPGMAKHELGGPIPPDDPFFQSCFVSGTFMLGDEKAKVAFMEKSQLEWSKLFLNETDTLRNKFRFYKFGTHSFVTYFSTDSVAYLDYFIGYDKNGEICRLLHDLGELVLHPSFYK